MTISNEECAIFYNGIIPSKICTKSSIGASACRGDSGSALMKTLNGIQIQIGVLNAGMECGMGLPNTFARISSYFDWIRSRSSATWSQY